MSADPAASSSSATSASVEDALVERTINTIRTLAMDAVQKANSGHPGTPMALAPLAYALWTRICGTTAARPDWAGPRPLRPLLRTREHAALRGAAPDGL